MHDLPNSSKHLRLLLTKIRDGDVSAREQLLDFFDDRLRKLTRQKLRDSPAIRRWEMTDDVAQNVALRLCRALEVVPLETEKDLVNLTAELVRRELADLARKHKGPQGVAQNHATDPAPAIGENRRPRYEKAAESEPGPETRARANELHSLVQTLPEDERVVFDRIHYLDQSQPEVAEELGVSVETVKRRYRRAKLRLAEKLTPDSEQKPE